MTDLSSEKVLQKFIDVGAILKGHFILSSNLRSDTYLQCALVLSDPKLANELCKGLAEKVFAKLTEDDFDIVVAPAMGGVVIGYEMARCLGKRSIFCERVDGVFTFRRGFYLPENARVLVVEDVITTGKSSLETFEVVKKFGGQVVAEVCLVDRSGVDLKEKLGVEVFSMLKVDVKVFDENNVPEKLQDIEAVKPGSRFLK